MKLSELGENAFLEKLRSKFPGDDRIPVGIGDDAAAVRVVDGENVLLSVDALVEGTHFTRDTMPPRFVGRKAVASSVSDIAAMGGSGLAVLLSLIVDPELEVEALWQIVEGAAERASELGMTLAGGNLSSSTGPLTVNVTAVGTTFQGQCLRRDGAKPGDGIYVTGQIGASACGLKLLGRGAVLSSDGSLVFPESLRGGPIALAESCIVAHLDPEPRLGLGTQLNEHRLATACIDVSDGLSVDLTRLCRASGVQARLHEATLPIAAGTLAWERHWKRDPTLLALSGGEDYELLFTARADADLEALRDLGDVLITKIGEVDAPDEPRRPAGSIELERRDGTHESLPASGWEHFSGRD